jgi:hypothetical protein
MKEERMSVIGEHHHGESIGSMTRSKQEGKI